MSVKVEEEEVGVDKIENWNKKKTNKNHSVSFFIY